MAEGGEGRGSHERLLVSAVLERWSTPPELESDAWDWVAERARALGVGPQLYELWGVSPQLPEPIRARLRDQQHRHALWNLQLFDQLAKVLSRLALAGVAVIPLKGVHLAEHVYRERRLRTMGDVDLLVAEHQLDEAESVLLACGFRPPSTGERRWSRVGYYHLTYRHPPTGLPLEMHWNVLPPGGRVQVDLDAWWRRSRPGRIAGAPVQLLASEDLLTHVVLHAAWKHRFYSTLRPFCDLREIVARSPDLDWGLVLEQASACSELGRSFALAFRVARRLGIAIPDSVLERLPAIPAPVLVDETADRLASLDNRAWAEKLDLVGQSRGLLGPLRVAAVTLELSLRRLANLALGPGNRAGRWSAMRRHLTRQLRSAVRFGGWRGERASGVDRWLSSRPTPRSTCRGGRARGACPGNGTAP